VVTTSPFSVRLAPKLKERLQAEAKRADRPLGHVMQRAVEAYLAAADETRAAIRAAVKRADAGHLISGEAVHAWIESWGADDEAPMPAVEKPKRRSLE
jgi:predicted transcriptional regulator